MNGTEGRNTEYPQLDGALYLDSAGAGLPPRTVLDRYMRDLSTTIYSNPHSGHATLSPSASSQKVDHVRSRILSLCHADPDLYSVIFVSNATAAFKVVAESTDWNRNRLWHLLDSHTSVVGMREYALQFSNGCDHQFVCHEREICSCRIRAVGSDEVDDYLNADMVEPSQLGLFVYTAQSNFNGYEYPLSWTYRFRERCQGWKVMVDASSFGFVDLSEFPADFLVLSFYKMIGFPTGIAALVAKSSALEELRKPYFGGGTVDAVHPTVAWHQLRKSMSARFEDGTIPFLDIVAVDHGLNWLEEKGGWSTLKRKAKDLARRTRTAMTDLRYRSNTKGTSSLCCIYSGGVRRWSSPDNESASDGHGPVISFNLYRADGYPLAGTEVARLAQLHNIHLRLGCFCNLGACSYHLGLHYDKIRENAESGSRVCGGEVDILEGRHVTAIRISFGLMNDDGDVSRWIEFLDTLFAKASSPSVVPLSMPSNRNTVGRIEQIFIYPIKSCGGFSAECWPLSETGLLYDRCFMLLDRDSNPLTQKSCPKMAQITIQDVDRAAGSLTIVAPGMNTLTIPVSEGVGSLVSSQICVKSVNAVAAYDLAGAWFSEFLDIPCRLVSSRDHEIELPSVALSGDGSVPENAKTAFQNDSQILLLSSLSFLDLKGQKAGVDTADISIDRFRGNLIIGSDAKGSLKPFDEEEWEGLNLHIANQVFKVNGLCRRCGIVGKAAFTSLSKFRRKKGYVFFGQHITHVQRLSEYPRKSRVKICTESTAWIFKIMTVPGAEALNLTFGALLPLQMTMFNVSARRVLEFTLWDINHDPEYSVKGVSYDIAWMNSESSRGVAVTKAIEAAKNQEIYFLIGEYSSGVTVPIALAMSAFKVFQCSGASTSPDLSNKALFPFFFRTVPSDHFQGQALVKIMQHYNWNKAALITINSAYGVGVVTSFLTAANDVNITILRNEAFNPGDRDYHLQMQSIRQSDARVMIVIGYDLETIDILKEADKNKLIGPDYVWIGTDAVQSVYNILQGQEYSDKDRNLIEGMIFTAPEEKGNSPWISLNERYFSQFQDLPEQYSYSYRDCMLTVALGLKSLIQRGYSLESIQSKNFNLSTFTSIKFEGSSGPMQFDEFGDSLPRYIVSNVVKGKLLDSIEISGGNFNFTSIKEVVFNGGSTFPPPDSKILVRELIERTSSIGKAVVSLYCAGMICCLLACCVIIINRNTPPIRQTSLLFLLIEALGLLTVLFSHQGWLGKYEELNLCVIQQWVPWVGFSLVMQAVIPRCFRIFVIFENFRLENALNLRNDRLFLFSLPITLINLGILAAWEIADPLRPRKVGDESSGRYHMECQSRSFAVQEAFSITLIVYNGLLLGLATFMAYATRNALSSYRETAFILYGAQNILLSSVVVIGLVYGISKDAFFKHGHLRFYNMFKVGRISLATLLSRESAIRLLSTDVSIGKKSEYMEGIGLKFSEADMDSDSCGHIEFVIPVKDGSRAFSTWKKKVVVYNPRSRHFGLLDNQTMVGEAAVLNSTVAITKSTTFADCVDLRYGSRYRILQFWNEKSADKFLELTGPGLKVGKRLSGLLASGEDLSRLRDGLRIPKFTE
ncbi:hypothetical protein HDU97_009459 [Phlyctochytrium planicorne]|nr:hypothetical protein HDU97_009459 [Phlyctochytrium planicorne]